MASCLTDDERERRYIALRKKKRRCDYLCGVPALIAICIFIFSLISILYAARDIMTGSGYRELIQTLLTLAAAAVAAFSAYSRNLKYILAAAGILILLSFIGRSPGIIIFCFLLIPAAIGAFFWGKLEDEEGFPLFRIPYSEMAERRVNAERKTRIRAELSGARRPADAEVHGAMGDLLDERENTPVLTAALHGYHERSDQAVGSFQAPASSSGEPGKMEEL